MLAHLLRGTGPAGLAGIYPTAGSIVRPLLGERREDLRGYLREIGQDWREDSTNRDVRRVRARIREQLLPLLERDFSPHAAMHLAGLARLAREEEVFWSALVEDRFRALVRADHGKPRLTIRARDLLLPLEVSSATEPAPLRALTERLIRRLYRDLHGDLHGLTSEHVERVILLASESASGRRIELPGGILVERNFDELIFARAGHAERPSPARETSARPGAYRYVVSLPEHGAATVSVPELKSRFCLKVIDWPIA